MLTLSPKQVAILDLLSVDYGPKKVAEMLNIKIHSLNQRLNNARKANNSISRDRLFFLFGKGEFRIVEHLGNNAYREIK